VTDPSSAGGTAFATADSWTESGITWNTAPPASGGGLASVGATTIGTWVSWDVTAAIGGNGNVDFLLAGGNGDSAIYGSRESTTQPQLEITP
jgi:hypothetical protein